MSIYFEVEFLRRHDISTIGHTFVLHHRGSDRGMEHSGTRQDRHALNNTIADGDLRLHNASCSIL